MKINLLLILIVLVIGSCINKKKDLSEKVIELEKIGINELKQIRLYRRGDIEYYVYSFNDSIKLGWSHDVDTDKFDYFFHPNKEMVKSKSVHNLDHANSIYKAVKALGIRQMAPRVEGKIIRFWFSQSYDEFIAYVDPSLTFNNGKNLSDMETKGDYFEEIMNGDTIKKNWFYVKINKE